MDHHLVVFQKFYIIVLDRPRSRGELAANIVLSRRAWIFHDNIGDHLDGVAGLNKVAYILPLAMGKDRKKGFHVLQLLR